MVIEESPLSAAADRDGSRHALRLACVVVLAIVLAGLLALPIAGQENYRAYSLFYEQFARIELIPLLVTGGFVAILLFALRRLPDTRSCPGTDITDDATVRGFDVRWLSIAVALVVWVGVRFVFHQYAFTDDEYSAFLQAQIYAGGASRAAVPSQWCPFVAAITPSSIASSGCTWRLGFLPLHSLFRAPFVALHIDEIAGALTAALSLLLVVSIARKQWPDKPQRAWFAGLFFATSTQLLFMSMTFFSMPTHLLASLVWLWLYVDNRRRSLFLLPWVGFVALGLHSPFPHAYFVAFFLLRYLRDRRFALVAYVGAVYIFALLFWHSYLANAVSAAGTAAALSVANASATAGLTRTLFSMPAAEVRLAMSMHTALVVTWSSPIAIVLALAAMIRWRALDSLSKDAALGIIFVMLARTFISPTPQGVGWGYRYIHDNLGTLSLLAALGAELLAQQFGRVPARRWILVASSLVLLQLPLRFVTAARIVDPYRRGSEWLASLPYDAVFFPADLVPWGRQLIRNDPWFRTKPILIDQTGLRPATIDSIRAIAGNVATLTPKELRAHGLPIRRLAIGIFQITLP